MLYYTFYCIRYVVYRAYILKKVIWLGDSKKVVSQFPDTVKIDFGFQIYLLQKGHFPTKSRPMKSIGASVFELKEQDSVGWYRVIYTLEVKNIIFVLHSFKKQSAKTAKQDLILAKQRLNQLRFK